MKDVLDVLRNARHVAILPHVSPDGDALGSSLALCRLIEALGGKAKIFIEEEVPKNLFYLKGSYEMFSDIDSLPEFDVAAAVDCGDLQRVSKRLPLFERAQKTINIDHHKTNTCFADINLVAADAAATAEIIYDLFGACGVFIDALTAGYLYAAIASDTGGFRYSNTTSKTHRIAASLYELGIDAASICSDIFEVVSLSRLKLEAAAINACEFYHENRTALVVVTDEMLAETGADESEVELSSLLRTIEGVLASVTIKPKNGAYKVSMRTRGRINAGRICAAIGGGGHDNAAGATYEGDLSYLKEELLKMIGEYM